MRRSALRHLKSLFGAEIASLRFLWQGEKREEAGCNSFLFSRRASLASTLSTLVAETFLKHWARLPVKEATRVAYERFDCTQEHKPAPEVPPPQGGSPLEHIHCYLATGDDLEETVLIFGNSLRFSLHEKVRDRVTSQRSLSCVAPDYRQLEPLLSQTA